MDRKFLPRLIIGRAKKSENESREIAMPSKWEQDPQTRKGSNPNGYPRKNPSEATVRGLGSTAIKGTQGKK